MKKIFLIACILFAPAAIAADGGCGENCVPKPDCESLGYRRKGDITCVDGYLTCPFDREYIWCRQYSCSDGGFSATNTPAVSDKMCAPVSFHGLNCFDCNQDKICKWTEYNKGDYAILSGECEKGTYDTCTINYISIMEEYKKKYEKALFVLPENATASDQVTITSCGQSIPFYTQWQCNTGFKEINSTGPYSNFMSSPIYLISKNSATQIIGTHVRCAPQFPSKGYSEISDCSGQEHEKGFIFEIDPNDPDPEHPSYGRCVPKNCPDGYDTQSAEGCDEGDFLAIDDFSGNNQCGTCRQEDELDCVEPYVDDGNGHCSCSKEHFILLNGQCQCNSAEGYMSDANAGCICNTSSGWQENGDNCYCPYPTLQSVDNQELDIYNYIDPENDGCYVPCITSQGANPACSEPCNAGNHYVLKGGRCECNDGEGWYPSEEAACSAFGANPDTDQCIKDGAIYNLTYNFGEGCYKVNTNSFTCDDGYASDGNGGCTMCNSAYGFYTTKENCEATSHQSCSATQYADGTSGCYKATGGCVSGYMQSELTDSTTACCLNDGTTFARIDDCVGTTSTSVSEYVPEDDMYYTYYIPSSNEYGYKCVSEVSYSIGHLDVLCLKRVERACAQGLTYVDGECVKPTCSEQDSNLVSANDPKVSNTTDYKCTDDTEGRTDAYGTCKKCIVKKTCYTKVGTPSCGWFTGSTPSGGSLNTWVCNCSSGELVTIVLAGSTLKPTETEEICGKSTDYFDNRPANCYLKDMSGSIVGPVNPSIPDIPAVGIK